MKLILQRISALIATIGVQRGILFSLGLFFSYSVLTFAGLYFSISEEMRGFLDSNSWWSFFFTLSACACVSFLIARISYLFFRAVLAGCRKVCFKWRATKAFLLGYVFFLKSGKVMRQYPLLTNAMLFAAFLLYSFLGAYIALIYIMNTLTQAILIGLLVEWTYASGSPIRLFEQGGKNSKKIVEMRVIQVSLIIALAAFNLGAHRTIYLSSRFVNLALVNRSELCAAVIAQTSGGIIVATKVRKFAPMAPYLVLSTSFFPLSSLDRISVLEGDECMSSASKP